MNKKRLKRILRLFGLGVVVLFICGYVGAIAFLRVNEASMVFSGSTLGDDWGPVPHDTVTMPWDSVRVRAADDIPVFLLESRLEAESSAPWVIFFHGNGLLVGSEANVERYRLLRQAGFNVLAVEYRGYGMSGGETPSEMGVYADARAGWDYLTDEAGVDPEQILLYGWSLGSGIATHLALRVPVAGLITEGAYTALPDVGQEWYPWLPISLIMRNRFDNLSRADSLSIPWLIFHGENDEVIPFPHAQTLVSAADDARLVALDAGHYGGVGQDPDVAKAAMQDFADEVLPDPTDRRDDTTPLSATTVGGSG